MSENLEDELTIGKKYVKIPSYDYTPEGYCFVTIRDIINADIYIEEDIGEFRAYEFITFEKFLTGIIKDLLIEWDQFNKENS
jgi:hypothetical protein